MSETSTTDPRPLDPLPYGTRDHAGGTGSKLAGEIGDRVNGFAEFIGILIGIGASLTRPLFAIGVALLCLGIGGVYLMHRDAPEIMAVGGLLIGLTAPLPWRSKRL